MTAQAVQTMLLPTLFDAPMVAAFGIPHQSSDRGGAILLSATDDALHLTAQLAA